MNFMEILENEQIVNEEQAVRQAGDTQKDTETPKLYSEEEFQQRLTEELDRVLPSKIGRKEAKLRKEYDGKYGGLMDVLKAGTGKDSVEEITEAFRQHYAGKGVNIPKRDAYSDDDIRVLAKNDAAGIIKGGYDEVKDELARLGTVNARNMSSRDKALFAELSQYQQSEERVRDLAKIGVSKDVYGSENFRNFASKFNRDTSAREIYDLYAKTHTQQKEINNPGSMKNNPGKDTGVKDFYTRDEALKFTRADLDKNPALVKAIENSMQKW